ncbi:MAG: glutamine-hydrolyzing GMP synthase [Chloroflexota bacterium]|nr:glutamine-hydrolyzing GMP synthase [Chloroflexota bacterium]
MPEWEEFIEQAVTDIRQAVGQERAVVALSGGVDSSATALLGHQVLGDRLSGIFVDTGFMRQGEWENVVETFAPLGIEVKLVEAQDRFFTALAGLTDPEEKRRAFRDTFYSVFGEALARTKASWLLQGTIAADVAETKGGVKTQHNVLEQIGIDPEQQFGLKVLEPLRTLYKHQVRSLAKELGLPQSMTRRMPFPGPGLSVRVRGEVTREGTEIVRQATAIVEEILVPFHPFQAFAVLLSDRATGLQDEKRAFGQIIAVRAVASRDAMTAEPLRVPWGVLLDLQKRITAEIPQVTKVVYDLSTKPPSTIEWE